MFDIQKIARKYIQGLKEYVPGKPMEEVKRELGIEDVLKLASNENPLGASPLAVKAMVRELTENCHLYPESLSPVLIARLADMHHLQPDQFLVNNGVDGVLSMVALAFIDAGDEVVTSQFTFPAYKNGATRMGANIKMVPLTPDWRFDIDGIIAAVTPQTKIVYLCNPNNPTATVTRKDEFDRLIAAVPENTLLISDEAYYEFVDDPDYPQTVPYMEQHPNLIVTRTFSKVMGLAGLRIGYAMAHPDVIRMLRKVVDPFPVNRIAQAGALASLDDEEFVRCSIEVTKAGRQQLYHEMVKMGLKPVRSQTNFVLVDLGRPSDQVYEGMLREGVIVRPLAPQGLPNCLRITVGTREQNIRALEALARALKN